MTKRSNIRKFKTRQQMLAEATAIAWRNDLARKSIDGMNTITGILANSDAHSITDEQKAGLLDACASIDAMLSVIALKVAEDEEKSHEKS